MSEKCPKIVRKLPGAPAKTNLGHFLTCLPVWSVVCMPVTIMINLKFQPPQNLLLNPFSVYFARKSGFTKFGGFGGPFPCIFLTNANNRKARIYKFWAVRGVVYFDSSLRAQKAKTFKNQVRKRWGFRPFQKEHQKVCKATVFENHTFRSMEER